MRALRQRRRLIAEDRDHVRLERDAQPLRIVPWIPAAEGERGSLELKQPRARSVLAERKCRLAIAQTIGNGDAHVRASNVRGQSGERTLSLEEVRGSERRKHRRGFRCQQDCRR